MDRPSATFYNRIHSTLGDFCYANFLAYYALENKSSKTGEYQPDELVDNLIKNIHKDCFYPPKIKLMISRRTMRCCKVK